MASGDTKTQQYLDIAARGTRADLQRGCCNTRTQDLIMDVAERIITEEETRYREDQILQNEIDEIKNNPDVADIVPTYAALQDYDTSKLTDQDIIRVLADETHEGASTYYRWSTSSQTFTYVGETGDYYTKNQVNDLLDNKQDLLTAGDGITIEEESGALVISSTGGGGGTSNFNQLTNRPKYNGATMTSSTDIPEVKTYSAGTGLDLTGTTFSADTTVLATKTDLDSKQDELTAGDNVTIEDESGALVISATDTTYSNFTGTDGTAAGVAGLVPAPATTDAGKFLKADGTWDTAGSSVNVVQTTGTSTTDVMSQNAVTSMVYADPATMQKIKIGAGTSSSPGSNAVEIGHNASATGTNSVSCGYGSLSDAPNGVAIGNSTRANSSNGATAIGGLSSVTGINGIAIGGGWQGAYVEGVGAINIGGGGSTRSVTGQGAISLGIFAPANSEQGKIEVGSTNTSYGYNSSNYRLLTGLYDPQSAHDAATKGYVDTAVAGAAYEPTISNNTLYL